MHFQSELCHIDDERAIVKITGWEGDSSFGSALGQANNAEFAEERAIDRLLKRKNKNVKTAIVNHSSQTNLVSRESLYQKEARKEQSANNNKNKDNNQSTDRIELINVSKEPKDWSHELAALEFELDRIGWDKEEETTYIKTIFGMENRSRITMFSDLQEIITCLKNVPKGAKLNDILNNTKKEELIKRSDSLLRNLKWDNKKGREFLNLHFNVNSRNELKEIELEKFNKLLSNELKDS